MLIKGARDEQDEIRISRPYSRQCRKARRTLPMCRDGEAGEF